MLRTRVSLPWKIYVGTVGGLIFKMLCLLQEQETSGIHLLWCWSQQIIQLELLGLSDLFGWSLHQSCLQRHKAGHLRTVQAAESRCWLLSHGVHCQNLHLTFVLSILICTLPIVSWEAMKKVNHWKEVLKRRGLLNYIFLISLSVDLKINYSKCMLLNGVL